MSTFLFAWNPNRWKDEERWMETAVSTTGTGRWV
jgi:hypothetical protein